MGELEKQAEKTDTKKPLPNKLLPIGQKSRYNPRNLRQISQIMPNNYVKFATKYPYSNGFYNGF